MGLRNLKSIKANTDFEILEETLSDRSNVYSVWVKSEGGGSEINCVNRKDAEGLYSLLSDKDRYYL